jgi:hypothetical protein
MVNLDLNEYSVIDNVLSELKVTPDKIELPIPAYYTKVNPKERKKSVTSSLNILFFSSQLFLSCK